MSNENENVSGLISPIPKWASRPEEMGRKLSLNVPATLRDQFAMAALTGLISKYYGDLGSKENAPMAAEEAYAYADAMIEIRKARGPHAAAGEGK